MANLQYIGSRYVPKFYKNPDDDSNNWKSGVLYEALTIVTYNNDSYTSKKIVPANISEPSLNPDFWVCTTKYSALISTLQTNVQNLENYVNTNTPLDTEAQTVSGAINEIYGLFKEPYIPVTTGSLIYTDSDTNKSTNVFYAIIDKSYKPRLVMAGDTLKADNQFIVADVGAISLREKATIAITASTMHSSNTTSGTVIIDGTVEHINDVNYSEWQAYDLENLYMTADGALHVIDTFATLDDMLALNPIWSFNGWQAIYKNGATVSGLRSDYLYPQDVIAQDNEGNYLVLASGGREMNDNGLNYSNVVDIIRNVLGFNATLIYGCDGGGSAALIAHQIRQNPLVDNTVRPMPTVLVFTTNEPENYSDYESGYSAYIADIQNKKKSHILNMDSKDPRLTIVGKNVETVGFEGYTGVSNGDSYDYTRLIKFAYDNINNQVYLDALNSNNQYHTILKLNETSGIAKLCGKEVLRGSVIKQFTDDATSNNDGNIDSNLIVSGGIPATAIILEAVCTAFNDVLIPYIYNGRYWFTLRNYSTWSATPNTTRAIRITWIEGVAVTPAT